MGTRPLKTKLRLIRSFQMLQWGLIFSNLAVVAYLIVMVSENPHGGSSRDWAAVIGIISTCIVNAIYVVKRIGPPRVESGSRLVRMANLWMTAKEEELRRRAQSSNENSN